MWTDGAEEVSVWSDEPEEVSMWTDGAEYVSVWTDGPAEVSDRTNGFDWRQNVNFALSRPELNCCSDGQYLNKMI